jgi:biotin carboxyl carrier protein
MSSDNGHSMHSVGVLPELIHDTEEFITVDQLQHLVHMFDQSDTVELEVRYAATNARLVLRKAGSLEETTAVVAAASEEEAASPTITRHTITASFVGIFRFWSKAREPLQMAVGDSVKEEQYIGIIQSLNILNEVEASVAGRIAAILVEDGQPVEFGQPLLMIDTQ